MGEVPTVGVSWRRVVVGQSSESVSKDGDAGGVEEVEEKGLGEKSSSGLETLRWQGRLIRPLRSAMRYHGCVNVSARAPLDPGSSDEPNSRKTSLERKPGTKQLLRFASQEGTTRQLARQLHYPAAGSRTCLSVFSHTGDTPRSLSCSAGEPISPTYAGEHLLSSSFPVRLSRGLDAP